jgi:hypothetical protein
MDTQVIIKLNENQELKENVFELIKSFDEDQIKELTHAMIKSSFDVNKDLFGSITTTDDYTQLIYRLYKKDFPEESQPNRYSRKFDSIRTLYQNHPEVIKYNIRKEFIEKFKSHIQQEITDFIKENEECQKIVNETLEELKISLPDIIKTILGEAAVSFIQKTIDSNMISQHLINKQNIY